MKPSFVLVMRLLLSGFLLSSFAVAAPDPALVRSYKMMMGQNALDLSKTRMGNVEAESLAEALKTNVTVTTVDISGNAIGPIGATALADVLKRDTTIQALNLSGNKIWNAGASALSEALAVNTALRELNLASNDFGNIGGQALAGSLTNNKKLEKLNLSSNPIGILTGKAFGELLKTNQTLKMLAFSKTQLGVVGTNNLLEGVKVTTSLEALYLDGIGFADEGASTIADVIEQNKSLKFIDVSDNNIGDRGKSSIMSKLNAKNDLVVSPFLRGARLNPTLVTGSFTYDNITRKIDDFYVAHPELKNMAGGTQTKGTYFLMQRYKELWDAAYRTHLAGSSLEIFFYDEPLGPAAIFDTPLVANFLADSPVKHIVTDTSYQFKQHEAFVNFANRFLGGDLMKGGLVQEEVLLFRGSILPWAVEARTTLNDAASFSFAPNIPLNTLNKRPVVLKFRIFNDLSIYGGAKLKTITALDKARAVFTPKADVFDIYVPSMAALYMKDKKSYTKAHLQQMYETAMRAFLTTLLALHRDNLPLVINTGNWGAGAFGNSIETSWALQRLAMENAYALFSAMIGQELPLTYVHNAFDATSKGKIARAQSALTAKIGNTTITAAQVIDKIMELTVADPQWQINK